MDATTLYIDQNSVDLIWMDDDGEVRSLASDSNLADFAWETDGEVFRMTPVPSLFLWLKISTHVRSQTGEYLDGNRNGIGGEITDDYLESFDPDHLPTCYTRDDIPDPCMELGDIPNLSQGR